MMPRKSTALAEAMKDPLIAALVGKMPMPGTVWPKAKRSEWLDLWSRAFNQIYEDAPPAGTVNGVAAGGAAAPATARKYYIEPDGVAKADQQMIDPHQIPPGTVVLDYRPSAAAGRWDDPDDPIVWLTSGAKVMRAPPGVRLRRADGPMPALNGSTDAGAETGA